VCTGQMSDRGARGRGAGGGGGGSPVHVRPGQVAQDAGAREGDLQNGHQQGGPDGNCQADLNSGEHDSKQGGVENNPVQLVHLCMIENSVL